MTVDLTAPAIEPGVFDLSDEEYFSPQLAGSTLSSTGARVLLAPGGPARYRYQADTGTVEVKRDYDLGHAVHTMVLGAGPEPVLFEGTGANPNAWQKDNDKAFARQLRAAGKVPLRPLDFMAAQEMARAVKAHPIAAKLLRDGWPERTLIWSEPESGVMCRAKVDWLRRDGMVDLKTTDSAAPDALSKAALNYGYAVQAAFYTRGFRAVDGPFGPDPFFVHIAVEKAPPYLVHVNQLTERAIAWGDRKVSEALEIFRDCTAAGVWPGFPEDEITDIDLPPWIKTEEW